MNQVLKLLCLEDSPRDAEIMRELLIDAGYKLNMDWTASEKEYVSLLRSNKYDVILADFKLPGFDGFTALRWSVEICPDVPFICVSGTVGEETAVELLKKGAVDYILKDRLVRLPSAVQRALEQHRIQIEKRAAELLLKENEEKLQSIFSAAPVGIGLVIGSVFIEVNDTFCKMTGYTRPELIGKNAETIYAKDEPNESAGIVISRSIADKGTGSVETRFKCKDGRILNIFLSSTPLDKDDLSKGVTFIAMDITDRKKAEEALSESQQLFQTLAQVSPVGIFRTNTDGYTTYLNPKYLELTGLSVEEALSFGWINAVHPDDRKLLKGNWLSDIQSRKTSYAEYRFLKPDKSIVWVIGKAVPEMIGNEVTGYIGTITDITDRKMAEEKLKSSEERLKILFDYAPDAYYLNDLKGNFIDGNIASEKLLGHDRNELIGKNFLKLDLLSLKQLPRVAKLLVTNSLGQGTGPDEFVLTRKDGSKVTVEILTHPVKIKDQTLVLGIARDITERKHAEDALRENEEKFRSILENSADAIFITDQQGKYVYTNNEVTAMLGYTSEEMKKKTITDLSPHDKTDRSVEILKKTLNEGKVFAEIELLKKDGSLISTDLNSVLLPGGLVYCSCRDITERKQAKEELIKAKDKAEEGDRLKTAFLHNISHEIRTPMNAIVGFSALLAEPHIDVQSSKDYIEVIMQSSNHLLAIISDIVDISNIEANLVKIVKNEININSTLQSLCNQFIPKANEKKIQLACETTLSDTDALVLTDSTKLNQILINLISNALKFTDKGSINIGYKVKLDFLEFCVSDTGLGIPQKYHIRIFERFYQVQPSISRLYEGTGLGLAISKAHVELMGGKIWLTSEPGKGTSFYFTIPYEKQTVKTLESNGTGVGEGLVFPVKKTILVAEDIDSNFKLIKYFLSEVNINLIRAVDGKEAVEKCLSNKNIDLILMDIKMPVMDGYTAVKLIREKNSTIPIIAQTAYSDDQQKALALGCSGFISKPFDKKGLLKILQEFI